MPIYRTVWEYQENNGAGFSEVFYRQATDLKTALTIPDELIGIRLKMLDELNKLTQIRVSDVAGNKPTGIKVVNKTNPTPTVGGPLPVGAAVVSVLTGANGGSRRWFMRGGYQNQWLRNGDTGVDMPDDFTLGKLKEFYKGLETNSFGIRTLQKVGNAGLRYYKILSVDGTAANGTAKINLELAPGYAVPSRVVISGVNPKDAPGINGHFQVLAVNNEFITINYTVPQNATIQNPGGKVKLEVFNDFSVFSADLCAFHHLGTRKSRNPLTHSAGRRRAVRLRNLA